MSERILVVDDEPGLALAMSECLRRDGFHVDTASNGEAALARFADHEYRLVFTDLRMPVMDGRTFLDRVRRRHPAARVVVVTAFATLESAVECVRKGAVDYLMKPFSPEALVRVARTALSESTVETEAGMIAVDPAILAAIEVARKAAATDATVLLEAESGAGKEVFARLIHRESPRRDRPFVAVNCAALPRDLLEAELFGHTRGAFTSADRERKGHFLTADGGTLLLDEIGEMSPDLQARLLRVLQEQQIRPVGSDDSVSVDVRVVAATNRNLQQEVAEGRFRKDLYFRLHVMPIRIPSLRERSRDIEPLARMFAERFAGPGTEITVEALAALHAHPWPGNVRELENAMQRAAILADGDAIDVANLALESVASDDAPTIEEPLSLEEAERDTIRRTLAKTSGNRTRAAELLGISPRTLRHKLKQFRDAGVPVPVPSA